MNKNIEVEGGEIAIRNSHGDLAIIPKDKKDWVKQKLSEGCHGCIDKLVETLPVMKDYAQDGSIYPSVRTTKFDDTTENKYQQWRASLPKNLQYEGDYDLRGFYKENPDFNINDSEQHLTDKWKLPNHPTFSDESVYYKGNENYGGKWKSYDYGDVYTPNNPEVKQQKLEWKKGFYSKDKVVVDGKLYDINTPEYKEIYDKGIGYFDKTGTFISSKEDLPEVTVSSKIQPNTVSSYISEFGKQTPKEEYLQNKSREHEKEFYSAPLWAQQAVGGYNDKRKANDKKSDEEEYNQQRNDFIAEKLLKRTPFEGMNNRINWMNKFTPQELETIKKSKYSSELEEGALQKFENFILGMNPSNWGVADYSKKGDFNTAYSSARQAAETEFMWNGKRYSTDIPQSNKLNKYIANHIYPYGDWSTSESDFKIDYDELMNLKYYDNGVYTTNKKLHIDDIKKITRNEKGKSIYDLYTSKGRSSGPGQPKDLNASYDALSIFNNQPQKYNSFKISKYKPSNSKDINAKYYSFNDKYEKQIEDDLLKYDNREFIDSKENKKQVTGSIIAGASLRNYQYSKGKDDRGDYIAYYDINNYGNILDIIPNANPFEIYSRIYYKDYKTGRKRMYYSDKELSELDIDKKNFDTLALQRELANRGYKLPKSTKKDGTFDGIWGDETKNALLEYRKSQNKLGQ